MEVAKQPAIQRGKFLEKPGQISMLNEVKRKLIHLSSLGIPLIYWFVPQKEALMLFVPAAVIAITIEILRRVFPGFDSWFRKYFGALLRPHETGSRPEVNGATYVLISACLCVAIFPKVIAITAFTVLIISDTASALYGRKFGKRKFLRKSIEGSSAFFVTAMIVVLAVGQLTGASWEFLLAGGVASLIATVVEGVSYGGGSIDDNLTIPTAFGAVLWIGLLLLERKDLLHLL